MSSGADQPKKPDPIFPGPQGITGPVNTSCHGSVHEAAKAKALEIKLKAVKTAAAMDYVYRVTDCSEKLCEKLSEQHDPDSDIVINMANCVVGAYSRQLDAMLQITDDIQQSAESIAVSGYVATGATGTHAPAYFHTLSIKPFRELRDRTAEVAQILDGLDPALGRTYRQIAETRAVALNDAARGAIFQTRQCLDHLVDRLVTDAEVMSSPYYTAKEANSKVIVTRRERLLCAIHKHVNDQLRAATLSALVELIVKSYGDLNRLHTRGPLDAADVDVPAETVKSFIEEFALALPAPRGPIGPTGASKP